MQYPRSRIGVPAKKFPTASLFPQQLQNKSMEVHSRHGRPLQVSASGSRSVLTFEIEATPLHVPGEYQEYPDGGLQAWLVVLGAWCAMVPTMGMINTFGVLQAWVAHHQLADYSESTVGWIF